jgi:putative transposase
MGKIDKLHTARPFADPRMLRDMLRLAGEQVGRRHISTLMKKMGIEALYRKPNTSQEPSRPQDLSIPSKRP